MGASGSRAHSPAGDQATEPANAFCPHFHAAVELIGRRWAGAILYALVDRPHYFRELGAAVPGMSDRLLSQRLRELEAEGLVERSVLDGPPARVSYDLTEVGRGLEPAIRELGDWAQGWREAAENGSGPAANGSSPPA